MAEKVNKEIEKEQVKDQAVAQPISENVDNTPKQESPKKRRRGINNETRSTTRRKFTDKYLDPKTRLAGVMFHSVEVKYATFKDTANSQFAGMAVPFIAFTLKSVTGKNDAEKAFIEIKYNAVESTTETMEGGDEAYKVDSQLSMMKHIIDVAVKNGKPLTDDELDGLELDFCDKDDDGNFIALDAQEVLDAYYKFYKFIVDMCNAESSLMFKGSDGKPVVYWAKLIRYIKSKKQWRAVNDDQLGFPMFVGEGILERAIPNTAPLIEINPATEQITLMQGISNTAKQPALGGVRQPGIPTQSANIGNIGSEAGMGVSDRDDLPF